MDAITDNQTSKHRGFSVDRIQHDLEALADRNERRGLRFTLLCAIASAAIPPAVTYYLGISLVDRSMSFWLLAILIECVLVLAVWYTVLIVTVPPREFLKKLIAAIEHAKSAPHSVSVSQGAREISILMDDERIILTGAEAELFKKHWFS